MINYCFIYFSAIQMFDLVEISSPWVGIYKCMGIYKLTMWPARSCRALQRSLAEQSTCRALHRYRCRGHGFKWSQSRNLIFRLQFDGGPGWLYRCNDQWCIHIINSFHNDAHIVGRYYFIEIISFKSLSFKFVLNLKDILLNYSKPELVKFLWGMCQSKCHQACKTYSNLCFGE